VIQIRETANYAANLDDIETYWDDCDFPESNEKMLNELATTTLANLQDHPRIGRNFLQRQANSIRAKTSAQKLQALLRTLNTDTETAEIREYVMTDYLLLYALKGDTIYLLAIKHHKQLSFDIRR
jgi:plasmid stabilization system protein ParE